MKKRKNNVRRIPIGVLLTFALLITACLAVLTMTVSGAEGEPTIVTTEAELTEALAAGGHIQLGADITATGYFNISSGTTVVLDLSGFTLNLDSYTIRNSGSLEVLESGSSGSIIGINRYMIYNVGFFMLTSGTVSNESEGNYTDYRPLFNNYSGEAVINGGTLNGPDLGISNHGILTINAGTVIGKNSSGIMNYPESTLVINGGEVYGITSNGNVKMTGGAVTGDIITGSGSVADFLAPGYLYYDTNGALITLTEGQTYLGGTVTVAPCQNHTGGTATCTTLAVCTLCKLEYGTYYHADDDGDIFCDVCGKLPITDAAFPDAIFRTYITENFDADADGLLSPEEIASVTTLRLEDRGLTDITGVNYFTEVTELRPGDNDLKALDLSGLSKLEYLILFNNYNLASLNLEGCSSLIELNLNSCWALASLNMEDCTALNYLDLSSCYKLKDTLDVSHLTELTYLLVDYVNLLELDLSANAKLEVLNIRHTGLTSLKLHPNADVAIDGHSDVAIQHCGVGYVNLGSIVSDPLQIVKVENGTLGADGWLKLDDGVTSFTVYNATGNADAPLPIWVRITNPDGLSPAHTFIDQIVSKDATQHYTQMCETCRTGNEEATAEHTYEEVVRPDFVATPATCATGTIYYKSCDCGKTTDETFEDTDLNPDNHVSDVDDGDCTTAIYCMGHHIVFTPAKDSHDFSGAYSYNDEHHWKKCQYCDVTDEQDYHTGQNSGDCTKPTLCDCGYVMVEATGHSSTTLTFYTDDYHYEGCSTCTLPVNDVRTPHDFSISDRDEYDHWTKCSGCPKETEHIPHSGDNGGDCTKDSECSCGYVTKVAETSHDFNTELLSDAEGHYHKCKNCDVIDEKLAHTPEDDDGDCLTAVHCTACGFETTKGYIMHNFDNANLYDESGHWEKCSRCDETAPKFDHSFTVPQKDGTHHWNKCDECDATDTKTPHAFTVAQNDATHHWNKCSGCDATDTKADHTDSDANHECDICDAWLTPFEKVSLSLGDDLAVNYFIAKGNFTDPQIRFTINGYTQTVDGVLEGEQFKFVFDGVAPQWIGDTIKAELIIGGEVVETKEYSVLKYLNTLKAKTAAELGISEAKYSAMQTLIADLLVYGGAAQTYTGHNTDALVDSGVTGSTFEEIESTDASKDIGTYVTFTGATVFFDSVNTLKFKFTATDLNGVVFKVKVSGGPEAEISYVDNGDGSYTITTAAIYADRFDDVYTVTAYKDGVADSTLTYSVRSYVYSKQDGTDPIAALAKATYNYGISAKAYKNAQ